MKVHTEETIMQSDLNSLIPKPQVTRREFVVTALSSGFALAVQPVSAAAITTDSEGLTTGEASIGRGYDAIPGYFARPAAPENFPTVLVVQEISVCTNTSKTSAAVSRSAAISRSRPSCFFATATSAR